MELTFTEKKNIRKNFGKLKESLSIPNLIEVQKNSYKQLTEFNPEVSRQFIKGFSRVFENIALRFVIVSSVSPDLEIITKQELLIFLIFLYFRFKLGSKLSKKKNFFFNSVFKKGINTFWS